MRRTLLLFILLAFSTTSLWAQARSNNQADMPRPQTPAEPFSYRVLDVTIPVLDESSGEQSHTLGATLTLPDEQLFGAGPYVGVVLISGSGMQDRDSTIFGHKPFAVIADYLTTRGIAVLRFDDRLVGASTGTPSEGITTESLAHDALSAAGFMMKQEHVDPERVGLLGHSEGGMHAPYLATKDESIAFVISLAGVGVAGMDLLLDQTEQMLRAAGKGEQHIKSSVGARRAIMNAVIDGESDEEIVKRIVELNRHEFGLKEANPKLIERSRALLPQFAGDWTRSFLSFDSRSYWKRIKVPALVLNGSKDLQVSAEKNLAGIRSALEENGRVRYTIVEMGGLNHLFQHAQTGMIGEYAQLSETFAPEALAIIEAWIRSEIVDR